MSTDNWHECVKMNVMSVRDTYSPILILSAKVGLCPWIELVAGVVLRCSGNCLMSCSLKASCLRPPLVLVCLLPGYNISPFCLKVKESRSRESDVIGASSVED